MLKSHFSWEKNHSQDKTQPTHRTRAEYIITISMVFRHLLIHQIYHGSAYIIQKNHIITLVDSISPGRCSQLIISLF
jgi:hypothetical protein